MARMNPSEKNLSSLLQQQIHNLQQAIVSNQQLQPVAKPTRQAPMQLSQLLQSVTQSVEVGQSLSQTQVPAHSLSQRVEAVTQSAKVDGANKQVSTQRVIQHQTVSQKAPSYQYKVRIINPTKKSDVKVRLIHNITSKFESVDALKQLLIREFKDLVPSTTDFEVGFMEGSQQAKVWLVNKEDLLTMYQVYKSGSNITLWCDGSMQDSSGSGQGSKRKRDAGETATRRQEKEGEVDDVFKELSKKHTEMENTKLRLWARMISGGLHDSYDEPPDIPAFHPERKKPRKESLTDALSGAATAICKVLSPTSVSSENNATQNVPSGISPSKTVNLRMKSYEQLRYLKKLHEDGILEDKEYCEQKGNIMMTLRKLN